MSLLLAVGLLAGNAFFVGAQFALIAARRDQIEPLAESGHRAARITLHQMRQLSWMLAGSQLGIAACSLGLGAVAEPAFAHLLESGFDALELPRSMLHPVAFLIALAIVSYAHMVIGEMVPKNLTLAVPLRAALVLGPPIGLWVRALRPVLVSINAAANGVLRLFRVEPKSELDSAYTPAELADLIAESVSEGLLHPDDERRLLRALRLERVTARDLTISLADLIVVRPNSTVAELEELVAATGYSRFPVLATDDAGEAELIGYVHAKDLLGLDSSRRGGPLPPRLVRPMATIDADLSLTNAFTTLQRAGHHLGRVSEDGHTLGVVALEDMVEELVGEIEDASHTDREEAAP
ncbi:MAG TPA: hemolysin family protein [Nocardioidaceae bacterium]|nr:hemolysin family protein [Nocardioidaceae bacterium]